MADAAIDANTMVQLVVENSTLICQEYHLNDWFPNIWHSHNPFESNNSLILLQLTVFVFLYRLIHLFLRHLGQLQIVSQLCAGLILGPTFLRRDVGAILFPIWGFKVVRTLSAFGVMIYHFTLGVKIDPTMVTSPGRRALIIGSLSFIIPIVGVSCVLIYLFTTKVPMGHSLYKAIPYMAWTQPFIGFPTVCCLLSELRILHTHVGRLAISSTIIYEGVMLILTSALKVLEDNKTTDKYLNKIMASVSSILLLLTMTYICRPLVVWVMHKTPPGKPMKESHLVIICVIVLFSGFISEISGQRYIIGPMVLGLLVPDGPPLGITVENRIETLVSTFLYPAFVILCGMQVDYTKIQFDTVPIFLVLVVVAFFTKLATTVLSSIYCKISTRESLVLGIVLNAKGIMELVFYSAYKDIGILQDQEFALCVSSVLMVTAIVTPIIKSIYTAPKQYVAVRRYSVQHSKPDGELRILVSIYDQESVPTIINILEASYASKQSPIVVMIMVLVELVGRAAPILVNNKKRDLNTSASKSERIVNALKNYEEYNYETVTMETFTAINDLSTMHDDICQVALDEAVNIVIVPFHKQWSVDGNVSHVNGSIRTMNLNVLEKAPCSVGILIDRASLGTSLPILNSDSFYNVAALFIGGQDDAESLAYGSRMVKHWKVTLTVIRFLFFGSENTKERKHDSQVVHRYCEENMGNERFTYMEETMKDGVGLSTFLKQIHGFDLILVGREHPESPIFIGMEQWSEYPELGVVPDMLASSDCASTASILVIQQHRIGGHMMARPVVEPSLTVQVDEVAPRRSSYHR